MRLAVSSVHITGSDDVNRLQVTAQSEVKQHRPGALRIERVQSGPGGAQNFRADSEKRQRSMNAHTTPMTTGMSRSASHTPLTRERWQSSRSPAPKACDTSVSRPK